MNLLFQIWRWTDEHGITTMARMEGASSSITAAWPFNARQKLNHATHMFPANNITEEAGASSLSSHVQITRSVSCGWLGGEWEIREIFDLLDISAHSPFEYLFLPVFLDFYFFFCSCWHACREIQQLCRWLCLRDKYFWFSFSVI